MKIILLCFFITVMYVSITTIIKFGYNRNTLLIILSKVWWLRGFFFLILYTYTCVHYMNLIDNNSRYYLLPFLITGIAGVLSMYRKTRKIGLYIAVITVCFGLFVILPLMGIINSYNSGNASTEDIIGAVIFIGFGLVIGIIGIKEIKKEN